MSGKYDLIVLGNVGHHGDTFLDDDPSCDHEIYLENLKPEVKAFLEAALAFYPVTAGEEEFSALVKAAETFASSVLAKAR